MMTKCYIVEMNSDNESMFEYLNDFGFDYTIEEHWPAPGYMEIYIDYYPHEIQDLESIMQWYV